jgi:GAF domain-containing protein
MERDREWFKSSCGLAFREVPRDESFCGHAIYGREPLVVEDALLDGRFADNPHVTGPPGIRFYAGHPLILANGSCVGTFCVLDTRPRHLDELDLARLRDLAALATRELELTK